MDSLAVILEAPEKLALRRLELIPPGPADTVVEVFWSGISTGTEKLLWTGAMPHFPGMGYPLVPGYESIGRIADAGADARERIGDWVFVPGAACYREARGLFGGTAQRVILPSAKAFPIPQSLGRDGVLMALAATALHAIEGERLPDLVVGHGVLGRLIARLVIALGGDAPLVWETNPVRREGARGYLVCDPADDDRRDYRAICDVSGDANLVDALVGRLGRAGEIILAGFYPGRISFAFAPAFMKEARLRIAAEWKAGDLGRILALLDAGTLDLSGLISDEHPAAEAARAYPQAFSGSDCLKMVLNWSNCP